MIFFAIQTPGSPKWITRVIAYEVMSPYTWSYVTLPRTGFWAASCTNSTVFWIWEMNVSPSPNVICLMLPSKFPQQFVGLWNWQESSLPKWRETACRRNVTNGKRIWDTTSNNKSHQFTGNWGLCIAFVFSGMSNMSFLCCTFSSLILQLQFLRWTSIFVHRPS